MFKIISLASLFKSTNDFTLPIYNTKDRKLISIIITSKSITIAEQNYLGLLYLILEKCMYAQT